MQAEAGKHMQARRWSQAEGGTGSKSYMQECRWAGDFKQAYKQAHKQKSKDR
jgi:hypothetical protein